MATGEQRTDNLSEEELDRYLYVSLGLQTCDMYGIKINIIICITYIILTVDVALKSDFLRYNLIVVYTNSDSFTNPK